jgi:hypothetical protein
LTQNDPATQNDFEQEMGRFVPLDVAERTVNQATFWPYLSDVVNEEVKHLHRALGTQGQVEPFTMKM